eukprot:8995364-Pyramimonas_sp.AAC.1
MKAIGCSTAGHCGCGSMRPQHPLVLTYYMRHMFPGPPGISTATRRQLAGYSDRRPTSTGP